MKAQVFITLKEEVLDPQGSAIVGSLKSLGFDEVVDARVGKMIELTLPCHPERSVTERRIQSMCDKLLANSVIENYRIELIS